MDAEIHIHATLDNDSPVSVDGGRLWDTLLAKVEQFLLATPRFRDDDFR
jgi:hypothetical protein